MSNIYKGEFQDYEGNVVYPHTSADVVFATDGQTIQKKLNDAEIDYTDVKAQLTSGEHEFRFGITADGEYGYHKEVEGADTVVPFSSRDLEVEVYMGNITAQKDYDYIILAMVANTADNFHTWLGNALDGHGGEEVGYSYKDVSNSGRFGYRVIKGIKKGTNLGFYNPPGILFCIGKKD